MAIPTSKPIFTTLPDEQPSLSRTGRARLAGLDAGALFDALVPAHPAQSGASQVTFNLFEDLVLSLRTALIEPFGRDGITWRGQLTGVANVRAYLSVTGLSAPDAESVITFGWVALDGQDYVIRSAGSNKVHIVQTPARPVACGDVLFAPEKTPSGEYYDAAELADVGDDSMAVIRVLALYPTDTKTSMKSGAAEIASMMAAAQMLTNEAFHHSGIAARVEIAAQELPSLRASDTVTLLSEVVEHEGGDAWKAVTAAREAAQASIVALLAKAATSADPAHPLEALIMGKAAMIPEPPRLDASDLKHTTFAVALIGGVDPKDTAHTFAHELGHLLGGKHDRLTQPSRAGLSPQHDYVRGYVPPDKAFVSLMGYDSSGMNYVPAYSAADKKWNDKPLGIPMGEAGSSGCGTVFQIEHTRSGQLSGRQCPPSLGACRVDAAS